MNELTKIRLVYAGLRSLLGSTASGREILQYTTALLDFFTEDENFERSYAEPKYRGFRTWDVDLAIAHRDGWKVYFHEHSASSWEDAEGTDRDRRREFDRSVRSNQMSINQFDEHPK